MPWLGPKVRQGPTIWTQSSGRDRDKNRMMIITKAIMEKQNKHFLKKYFE